MLVRSMKLFGNLISLFGLGKPNLDPIANLPVEVTHSIFRMLDPNSLLNAARVSKEWFYVCRGDSHLRATARRHLRKEKRLAYGFDQCTRFSALKRLKSYRSDRRELHVVPAPVVFTFGAAGIFSGRTAPKNAGHSGPQSKVEAKRMTTQLR
uniref:SconB_1 protein n=1 Tax=Fopius arisanus TaxID=64838 RepID=A0A0C9RFV8_9HYME